MSGAGSARSSDLSSLHVASGDLFAGAEVQVATLVPALERIGSAACVVTFNDGLLASALRRAGTETRVVPESGGVVRVIADLRRVLRETRPTLVHSHGYKEAILSHIASLGLGVGRVRTIHGVPELRLGGSAPRMLAYDLVERFLSWLLGVHAIAVSRELERAQSGRRTWRRGVSYVPNTFPAPVALPGGSYLDPWPPDAGQRLLYVGRLEPVKGPDLLLEAFRRIHAEVPAASLCLAGEGSLRQHLEQEIGELGLEGSVRLLGESRCVPELMKACDLLVIPSRGEGMPTVLLEALAAGVAVVATAVGAIPDVTQDGSFAALVPPDDAPALAEACIRLLRDDASRAALAARGSDAIRREYSPEACAQKTFALYETVCGTRKGLRATSR
jgi:glycosyltransferase involved in cell wall biosynthesis